MAHSVLLPLTQLYISHRCESHAPYAVSQLACPPTDGTADIIIVDRNTVNLEDFPEY